MRRRKEIQSLDSILTRYGKRERLGPTTLQTFALSGTDSPGLKEVSIQPKKVIGVPSYLSTTHFKDVEAEYQVSKARIIDIVATHTNQKTTPAPAEPSGPSPSHDTESTKEKQKHQQQPHKLKQRLKRSWDQTLTQMMTSSCT